MNFPLITKLDLLHDIKEDRLLIIGHLQEENSAVLAITRRLLKNFLMHFEQLLNATNPSLAHACLENKTEVMQMEYLGALAEQAGVEENTSVETIQNTILNSNRTLVEEVKFEPSETMILIGFLGRVNFEDEVLEPLCALNLERNTAHKLIEILYRKAEEAEWGLTSTQQWISNVVNVNQEKVN